MPVPSYTLMISSELLSSFSFLSTKKFDPFYWTFDSLFFIALVPIMSGHFAFIACYTSFFLVVCHFPHLRMQKPHCHLCWKSCYLYCHICSSKLPGSCMHLQLSLGKDLSFVVGHFALVAFHILSVRLVYENNNMMFNF